MKISARTIKDLPPGLHRVEKGLYVRVRNGHASAWILNYMINRKRTHMSLGLCDEMSITEAKTLADKYRGQIAQGIDPAQERRERKAKISKCELRAYTFADLVDESLPVIAKAKRWSNEKHSAQWVSTIKTYALPSLKDKEVERITRDDIIDVLRPIWESKTETANRLRGRLEAVFGYAIATGRRKGSNPCTWRGNLDLFLPSPAKVKPVKHHDAVPFEDVREVFSQKWNPPPSVTAAAIIFGTLTCSRAEEFVYARWKEIDFDNAVWSCPPERRKDRKNYPHRVPLSKQALYILSLLDKKTPFIFMGKKQGCALCLQTPCSIVKKTFGFGTMHGMRSTFRDWAAENGIDRVLAEKSLMHATGNEVEQAYQRSDLLEQRRPVLQAWADAIYPVLDEDEKKD